MSAPAPKALVCGHFGEWVQGRMGADGPLVLVTLPCPMMTVHLAGGDAPPAAVDFSEDALAAFREDIGAADTPWPALSHRIPPGCGAGASTATLVALARGIGFDGDPLTLARACLRIEGASDPLMFDVPDQLLWASREARIVERFVAPPEAEIVGGYWGPPQRTHGDDTDFPDISDLIAKWRGAAARGQLAELADLASISAARCSAHRGPADPMADLARDSGALGHARAHTGSARALVFAPGSAPDSTEAVLHEAGLQGVFRFRTGP
jgi:uncharacterized protein involved in propanediol utilization